MAPNPANRRSGHSRRAQYGTFFGYIAGIAGAIIGAGFLIVSILDPDSFSGLRGVAADAAAPGGKAAAVGRDQTKSFFDILRGYALAGSRNAGLERELAEAKTRLAEAQATAEENRRLKALLDLAQEEPRPIAVTQLVAATGSSTRRFATIAAGADRGVTVGMPVRSPLGLVGRVLEVGGRTSRILLVTDTESVVPARRASDGLPAFVQGRGDGQLQLRLINLGLNPLKRGDLFVTSGSGGLYRPGTALAVVMTVTRDGAIARLLSDPAATEFVTVEPVWAPPADLPASGKTGRHQAVKVPLRLPSTAGDRFRRRINRAPFPLVARGVPWASVVLSSLLPALLFMASAPYVPPFGFLTLVAWRQLRPGLLPVWAGLPLGFFDDLYSGQPMGSGILLWSAAMIVLDAIEARFPWRSFSLEWLVASALIVAYILACLGAANAAGAQAPMTVLTPQIIVAVLAYPIIGRIVAALDRFRLIPFMVVR